MPSLKDLAKECGVSVATVSKALNDQPDIAQATRERIHAAARRMGYLPNAAARALKTNRTYNLGVLFVDEKQSGLTHEYFSAVLDSFKVEAEKRGYDITFINHNISGRSMSYLEHCHYRGVDGVVIACVNFYDPQVVELVNGDVPVVTIDHVFNNRMAILSDNVVGTKALVQQAWACGHRRIAFIHGEKTAVTENRLAGFYQACEELGLKVPEQYVRCGVYHDVDRCAEETRALLALPQRPTCIIFPDDFSALGGYNALAEAGLSIPEDISVMGYDGIYLSRVVKPSLVTYQQNTKALGRLAADKLIELIERCAQEDRYDFVNDILVRYRNLKRIYAYKMDSYWSNIASVESYYKTNMDFLKPEVRDYFFRQYPEIYTKVGDMPPAKYNPGASVKNSLVASGSIINGVVENSVLFRQAYIGNNCVIKNSIILNDVYIGDNTVIENCIVESRDTIRANTTYIGTPDNVKIVIEKNERYTI